MSVDAVRRRLARPEAWLEAAEGGYVVRAGGDRRRRAVAQVDEAGFRALVAEPGLRPRPGGGWTLVLRVPVAPAPPLGRPGVVLGERAVAEADGRIVARSANLAESPIAWLARRRDAQGRPWLTPVEAAAGERLIADVHRAGVQGRLTMSWDAGPRARAGRGPGAEPAERAWSAKARVAAALAAAGPGLREMLERVCVAGASLETAERDLRLPRRSGKAVLKLALGRLATHYGAG